MRSWKRLWAFLLMIALVASMLVAPLSAYAVTSPSYIKEGDYYIVSAKNRNYALDVTGGGNAREKTYIQLYKKNNTDAQIFTIKRVPNAKPFKDTYLIIHKRTGLVMNIKDGYQKAGARVWLYHNDGTDACRWYFKKMDGGYAISSVYGAVGTYVDVCNGKMSNGSKIQMWSYNGNANQRWILTPVK